MQTIENKRCWWCGDDPLYQAYHDNEWGVPVHDERGLFEFLCLEGAQAGLSWITILRKREHYRLVFDQFDIDKIARYDEAKIASLQQIVPDFEERYDAVMAGLSRTEQLRVQAEGEMGGSGYMSQFAAGTEGAIAARFESLALCEEANSRFLSCLISGG